MITLEDILAARTNIAGKLHRTPMLTSSTFSEMTGLNLSFKAEFFQKTGSFKPRGVLNKIKGLTSEERERGLIAVSAGNHAQAVAYGALIEQISAHVVMPANAVKSKADGARGYGANVILHGEMSDLFPKAEELIAEHGYTFIHPFDDPKIMAGQGTAGLEILEDVPDVEAVIVPIGGGGLISGVAAAIKLQKPNVKIIGVEPTGAASMKPSLEAGHPITLDKIDSIADGLSAPFAGKNTYEVVKEFVDEIVLVEDSEIAYAIKMLLERMKILTEPAGAAGFASLLSNKLKLPSDSNVVVLLCGGNLDLAKIDSILALGDKHNG